MVLEYVLQEAYQAASAHMESLEEEIAAYKGGYKGNHIFKWLHGNIGIISTLTREGDTILAMS